jgi:hypothetical protein
MLQPRTIKILITNSYGAGWATWTSDDDVADFILTYKPIIDYLDSRNGKNDLDGNHPLIAQLLKDIYEKFGPGKLPYLGGAENLEVREVTLPDTHLVKLLRIRDYDGKEFLD